jgi:hypothetical protein
VTGFKGYESRAQMVQGGWDISAKDSVCKGCGQVINWATSPKGKRVSLDNGATTLHVQTCSGREQPQPENNSREKNQTTSTPDLLTTAVVELTAVMRELIVILRARQGTK